MKKTIIIFLISILYSFTTNSQSPYIYGLTKNNFQGALVRLNYLTGKYDTLLDVGYIELNYFASCADSYNDKFICCGTLGNSNDNYHIIDLNSLNIESFSSFDAYRLEFNNLNQNIVFVEDTAFYSLDLSTKELKCYPLHISFNGILWGKTRTINPKDSTYIFIAVDLKSQDNFSIVVINSITGEIKSKQPIQTTPMDLVTDFETGKIFGLVNNRVVLVDPYKAETTDLLSIPDWGSQVDEQMAVYDQLRKNFIVPYLNSAGIPKLAVLNMVSFSIDTIYLQPNQWMNYQQIGNYPQGISDKSGIGYLQIVPNPFSDRTKVIMPLLSASERLTIAVYNQLGLLVMNETVASSPFELRRGNLPSGMYFLIVTGQDCKVKGKGKLFIK